jgi:hypothetical protein
VAGLFWAGACADTAATANAVAKARVSERTIGPPIDESQTTMKSNRRRNCRKQANARALSLFENV